jgi:hypothetical protein
MGKKIDIIGQTFGKLTAIEDVGKDKWRQLRWRCRCECGNYIVVVGGDLRRGNTLSCGCLQKDLVSRRMMPRRVVVPRVLEYGVWASMKGRCNNKRDINYKHYGGRGIKVCNRWLNGYENFMKDMGDRPEGLTLDRIDNNGNYEPSNCRWATRTEQQNNKRNNKHIVIHGITYTLKQASESFKIKYSCLRSRIYAGREAHDAIFTP